VCSSDLKNEGVLSKHRDATQERFDVGEVTRTDVAQSNARLSLATSERVQAEADEDISRTTFERIVREEAAEILKPAPKMANRLPSDLQESVELAMQNNPSLLQQVQTEDANKYAVKVQSARLYPSVSLVGSMQRDLGNPVFGNQAFRNDTMTVNVNIPLYQSGQVYSLVRQAKRTHSQSMLETRDTLNRVKEAVTRAWEQLDASRATIVATESAIEAATLALEGVQQEYLYGARTTLDVLDAEQELFEAQVNLVTAKRNEAVAEYNLIVLLGQFTAEALELPVQLYDEEEYYNNNAHKILGF